MIKDIFKKIYKFKESSFLKYSYVGIANTALSFLIGVFLRFYSSLADSIIYSISTIFGFILSLVLNLNFTFKSKINPRNISKYTLCFLISLSLSTVFSKLCEYFQIQFVFNQLLSMLVYTILNYSLLKRYLSNRNKS